MSIHTERKTKETGIRIDLDVQTGPDVEIDTTIPFFDHMLTAMGFHGGMTIRISANGDTQVDQHHLVEDVGIVLGDAFKQYGESAGAFHRFGHAIIPMDDALSEVVVDVAGRPYLVYTADYPQPLVGNFDIALVREFLLGLSNKADLNLHCICRYGENSHHMAESLFKALGIALSRAYSPIEGPIRSTKGQL